MTAKDIQKINPRARGYYSHPSILEGVRVGGLIRWYRPTASGWVQTGSTETTEGAEYVRVC